MKFVSSSRKILESLKIFDPTGDLSITNILLMIVAFKIAASESFGWDFVLIVFLALTAYSFKRFLNFKRRDLDAADQAKLHSVETRLRLLESDLSVKDLFK